MPKGRGKDFSAQLFREGPKRHSRVPRGERNLSVSDFPICTNPIWHTRRPRTNVSICYAFLDCFLHDFFHVWRTFLHARSPVGTWSWKSSMLVFLCYVICDIAYFLQPLQCSANTGTLVHCVLVLCWCWLEHTRLFQKLSHRMTAESDMPTGCRWESGLGSHHQWPRKIKTSLLWHLLVRDIRWMKYLPTISLGLKIL